MSNKTRLVAVCFSSSSYTLSSFCVTTTLDFITDSCCLLPTSVSGMHLYSCKEDPSVLAEFIRRLCSDSIQTLLTPYRLPGRTGWASWGLYCELRLMTLSWSTWRTLHLETILCIPMEFSTRRMQRVQCYIIHMYATVCTQRNIHICSQKDVHNLLNIPKTEGKTWVVAVITIILIILIKTLILQMEICLVDSKFLQV